MNKIYLTIIVILCILLGLTYYGYQKCITKQPTTIILENLDKVDSLMSEVEFLKGRLYSDSVKYSSIVKDRDSARKKSGNTIVGYKKKPSTEKDKVFETLVGVSPTDNDTIIRDLVNVKLLKCDSVSTELDFANRQVSELESQVEIHKMIHVRSDSVIRLQAVIIEEQSNELFDQSKELSDCKFRKKRNFWRGFGTGIVAIVATIIGVNQASK